MSWWDCDRCGCRNSASPQVKIISSIDDCYNVTQELLLHHVLGFDMEGINLGATGPISLVQLCTLDERCFIFDIWSNPDLLTEGGLVDILEANEIVKVVHGCINDSAALYFQYGVILVNVFDTQVAHAVLQYQQNGKPIHLTQNESLNKLCEIYDTGSNPLKNKISKMYKSRQRFWSQRPLTDDMIRYAAFDVFCLVPNLYDCMINLLKPESKNLLNEACEEQVLCQIDPKEIRSRKRRRKNEFYRTSNVHTQQNQNRQQNFNRTPPVQLGGYDYWYRHMNYQRYGP